MSDYEKRYHIHYVSAENAARGEYDGPAGFSAYRDSWDEIEQLAAHIGGWERIAWISEGGADYEYVAAGSKRRNSDGEYRVGIEGTIVTRTTTAVVYTAPAIIRRERRQRDMADRVVRAMRDGRTVSVILRANDERLSGIVPDEATDVYFEFADVSQPRGVRRIYYAYVAQLVCQGERL